MKLFLLVDAAYAFDYLAILQVKASEGLPVNAEIEQIEACLGLQVPDIHAIRASKEFHNLYDANIKTFDAVDLAWRNEISAKDVQVANQQRFKAKQRLQARFWPNTAMAETKSKPSRKHN
jgi:hypothetical protein